MRRLRGIDAVFLYGETPRTTMHTLKTSILDPSSSPTGYSFDRAKQAIEKRIHRLPPFRWRVVWVPFGLHHPLWVDDPDFDLDYHVRRIVAPPPGGRKELCGVISEIAEQPLDYSKPLWEVYLVEGLEGGRVASVAKIHHAVADGVASAEMLEQFYDPEPTDPETLPAPPPYQPAPMPSKRSLIRPALADVFKLLRDGLPHILRLRKEAKARVAGRGAEHAPPKAYSGPSFSFSRTISSHRVFTCVSFSLDEIREVKAAFDTTINDVILAMSAGALRRYLQKRGDLPDQPLVAGIPVSMRGDEHKGSYGNVLGSMYVALRTDVADPVERLRATHEAAKISKTEFRATWGARLENWIEFWPPILCKVFGRFSTLMAKKGKVDRNLIISNVTGPRQYLYAGKTRVESFFSVGPVLEGSGVVNITAWSYANQLNFALLACREAIPDLWEMTDGLRDALEELKKAAAAVSVSKPAATDGRRDGRELEVVAPDGGEIYVHQTS